MNTQLLQRIENQVRIAKTYISANGPQVICILIAGYCIHFLVEGVIWLFIFVTVSTII